MSLIAAQSEATDRAKARYAYTRAGMWHVCVCVCVYARGMFHDINQSYRLLVTQRQGEEKGRLRVSISVNLISHFAAAI